MPCTIFHTLAKLVKHSLHLHLCMCVCVYVIEPVSAGVCRVMQSARRCLSLSTTDRHAGPPGGKVGLQLSVPLRRAERQACDFAVTRFHQLHTCCLPLCHAKVFDLAKQLVTWLHRKLWRWWYVGLVQLSVLQYLVTGEIAKFWSEPDDFALTFRWTASC